MSHRLVSMEVTADIATLYLRENAELLNALEIDAADAHALTPRKTVLSKYCSSISRDWKHDNCSGIILVTLILLP